MDLNKIRHDQMIAGENAVIDRLKKKGLVPLPSMNNKTPRRIRLDLNRPAELAIRTAIDEVEKVGADVRLTEAVLLLDKARNLVADYIDEKIEPPIVVTKEQMDEFEQQMRDGGHIPNI